MATRFIQLHCRTGTLSLSVGKRLFIRVFVNNEPGRHRRQVMQIIYHGTWMITLPVTPTSSLTLRFDTIYDIVSFIVALEPYLG